MGRELEDGARVEAVEAAWGPSPSHPLLSHPSPCFTPQHRAPLGFLAFTAITIFSLGFVIFLTSVQTLSGLRQSCRGCPKLPCRIGLRRSGEGAATTPASAHSASPTPS